MIVVADRPSAAVLQQLNRATSVTRKHRPVHIVEAAPPVLSAEEGEQWSRGLNHALLETLRVMPVPPTAIMVWDDDMLFSELGIKELNGHLGAFAYDRYEALSLFFWNHERRYNATPAMLGHWSPVLFRYVPGDLFPDDFVVAATRKVARSKNVCRLAYPALNYGYMRADDRANAWQRTRDAGRVDAFTIQFANSNPPLRRWRPTDSTPSVLRRLAQSQKAP